MADLTSEDVKQAGSFDLLPTIPATARFGVFTAGVYSETTFANLKAQILAAPPAANTAPTVSLQPVTNGTATVPITLVALATAVAPSTIAKVEFFNGGTKIGQATSSPFAFDWTPSLSDVGTRSLTAKATDSAGNQTTSAPQSIVITPPFVLANRPPVVKTEVSPDTGVVGEPIAIEATATDSDGQIVRMEFFNGSTLLQTVTTTPYTYVYTPADTTMLFLSVKAFDNLGSSSQSPLKTITVVDSATVPGPPTGASATAGNNTVTVSWQPPANNGGSPVTSFKVFRNDDLTPIGTVNAPTATYTDNSAANGQEYVYAIRALNAKGQGAPSDPTEPVTPALSAPPTFNTTYNPGENISTVTWNASPGTQLKLNLPLSTNSDPNPATMTVFAPGGTDQVGQADFSGFDTGVACAVVYQGVTYYLNLTNGDVTLA